MRRPFCPLLALSGHVDHACECPLSGVKRTCLFAEQMSALSQSGHDYNIWTNAGSNPLPATQTDLSDALGMASVT